MKLTKETAIILTYQLWKWMQDNGTVSKRNWPGWEMYGKMDCFCPCCEYKESVGDKCPECAEHCPLIELWPNKELELDTPCCEGYSPYAGFERDKTTWHIKKAIVNKMVSAIEGEMKRLGIKNREIKP